MKSSLEMTALPSVTSTIPLPHAAKLAWQPTVTPSISSSAKSSQSETPMHTITSGTQSLTRISTRGTLNAKYLRTYSNELAMSIDWQTECALGSDHSNIILIIQCE